MTKEQQELFDAWSKEDIYEAYLLEHKTRTYLNDKLSESQLLIAEYRADKKKHAFDILAWAVMNPRVYYKKGKPFGLIGQAEGEDGILYLACMVEDVDKVFTIEMIKDIIRLYETRTICLITDVESKQELIRKALSRYNFTYAYKDGIMYSTGGLSWQ